MKKRFAATLTFLFFLLALSGGARAAAVIKAEVVEGDATMAGGSFHLRVAVTENDTGRDPGFFTVNILFDDRAIEAASIRVENSGLGTVTRTPVEGSGSNASFNVTTTGSFGNSNPTPELFTLEMTMRVDAEFPHSIEVRESFLGGASLTSASFIPLPISHVYDNSAVTNLGEPGGGADPAVITAEIVQGDPTVAGSTFRMRVAVTENETGRTPAFYTLNVRFDERAIERNSISVVGTPPLGSATRTPVEGSGSNASFTVTTAGDSDNTEDVLELFTLEMRLEEDARFPYSIEVRDSFLGERSLTSTGSPPLPIPHQFDNSAVTDLCDDACLAGAARDALLGRAPARESHDLNGDGLLDAADLAGVF